MIVVLTIISELIRSPKFKKVKPLSLHCSLLVFVFVYAFVGGLIFTQIEISAAKERDERLYRQQTECVATKLALSTASSHAGVNRTAQAIAECFKQEVDIRSQWGYVTGTLYGFGIVTTLGYNRIAPITTTGRLFCVLYGLCGIPVTMIIIANMGQYFNNFATIVKKKIVTYQANRQRRLSAAKMDEDEVPESSTAMVGLALLAAFILYVVLGAILLPLLNGEFDFLNGIYHNFICLTAIDFGSLVPTRVEFLPITFMYVCFGLAMTTIAIQVGSEYMKKLHHIGQNLKNVAHTKVWFGGKT
ncbi:unnamed protein product [Bursaphelenchus okinawaensis]|uniref:Potassium channel domain-containing protein n=1 Tax=Bursaphelenchus okinawaensis TaxID=465554 RepID=A0A811LHU7_9BILA|nr:unnamed protein product [Bursaphelenchus okinawaensis]CAG9123521.1 unnamed protein product [Bursaphelenchus okinawaensis]